MHKNALENHVNKFNMLPSLWFRKFITKYLFWKKLSYVHQEICMRIFIIMLLDIAIKLENPYMYLKLKMEK